MNKFLKMGPVIIELRDFPIYIQYPFGAWKLDPFIVGDCNADITVVYKKGAVIPPGEPIVVERSVYAHNAFYRQDNGCLVWQQTYNQKIQLQYIVSGDGKTVTVTEDNTNTFGVALFESLTFVIFALMINRGVLSFHGALVEYDGMGIIFSADSGVGKTTQARLWRDYKNALVLNGDRSSCFQIEDKWFGFGSPWCGTSGEYLNRKVPVKGLVIVKRGDRNKVRQLQGMEALGAVMPHVLIPGWNSRFMDMSITLLDGFLDRIKVYELECTPDIRAVEVLYKNLFD